MGLAWGLGRTLLRFWWAAVCVALAGWGFASTIRHAHRPAWFWLFCALVPVVIGVTIEWLRLWKRVNDEEARLGGLARRLAVELSTMELDLNRIETAGRYDGFVPLPSATWTAEGRELDR